LTAVAAQYAKIQKLGAEILAISVDTVFAHKTWHEQELSKMVKGGIPYPMLSDPGGKLGTTYEVYNPEAGLHNRGQFIIDPDGIIQAIEVLNAPVGRNVEELLRQIEAFQCVRESKGTEAIPAGWVPGKKTLKPGPDLVRKVCTVWESD
jgi:peroxiredoxin (alkyl hydroperoxide reductase subunit C)